MVAKCALVLKMTDRSAKVLLQCERGFMCCTLYQNTIDICRLLHSGKLSTNDNYLRSVHNIYSCPN